MERGGSGSGAGFGGIKLKMGGGKVSANCPSGFSCSEIEAEPVDFFDSSNLCIVQERRITDHNLNSGLPISSSSQYQLQPSLSPCFLFHSNKRISCSLAKQHQSLLPSQFSQQPISLTTFPRTSPSTHPGSTQTWTQTSKRRQRRLFHSQTRFRFNQFRYLLELY